MMTMLELPADKVAQVADKLAARVGRYEAAKDSRATFAYVYYRLTASLATSLRTGATVFRDPDWVAELSYSLASAYFVAMDGIDTWLAVQGGGPHGVAVQSDHLPHDIPQPWRDVYAASSIRHSYVMEDVLFSMMAHMSYDLPVTLHRMAERADGRRHIADFHRMNDVLGAEIDDIQNHLAARYSNGLAFLDRLFAREDELLTNYGIRLARGMAWFNSDRLRDPEAAAEAMESITLSTAALIAEVRCPDDWILRWCLLLLRWLIPERRQWPAPGLLVAESS